MFDRIVSVISGILFCAGLYLLTPNLVPADIVSPYLAGWFYGHGQPELIYSFAPADMFAHIPPEIWRDTAIRNGYAGGEIYPYLYPPVWAALLAPLVDEMSIPDFTYWVYVIQILLIWFSIVLAWKTVGKPFSLTLWSLVSFFVLLGTAPALDALAENQPHIAVVFLIILAFERMQSGRSLFAGVLLGIAAAIKLFPVILILLFVFKRDVRGFFAMVATILAFMVLSFALCGEGLNWAFVAGVRAANQAAFISRNNWCFSSLLYQFYSFVIEHGIGSAKMSYTAKLPYWIGVSSSIIWVFGSGYWMWRAERASERQKGLAILIIFTWMAYFGPLGWPYYYLPVIYFLPLVVVFFTKWQNVAFFGGFILLFQPIILKKAQDLSDKINVAQVFTSVVIMFMIIGAIFLLNRVRIPKYLAKD